MTILGIITLFLAISTLSMVAWNALILPPLPRPKHTNKKLSVLIPARNEAANIGALLDTLLPQPNIDAEFIVIDDHSTDATATIVQTYAARDARVRLLQGKELPAGWSGKNYGCQQMAEAATGDYLLFLDADVRLTPEALPRLLARMEKQPNLALLSGVPCQVTPSFAEKLIPPLIAFLIMGYLPIFFARLFPWAAFGAAVGQAVLVRRDSYFAAGGHAAVKATLHDGIEMARLMRRKGFKTDLCAMHDLIRCRMYADFKTVWYGFAKNANEAMARPVPLAIWTFLLGGGHILPYLLLPFASGEAFWLLFTAAAASMLSRLVTSLPRGESLLGAVLHPFGIALFLAINYWSLFARDKIKQQGWRGRVYTEV